MLWVPERHEEGEARVHKPGRPEDKAGGAGSELHVQSWNSFQVPQETSVVAKAGEPGDRIYIFPTLLCNPAVAH